MEVALVPISDGQTVTWCPSEIRDHWETAACTKTKGCAYPQACSRPRDSDTKYKKFLYTEMGKSVLFI